MEMDSLIKWWLFGLAIYIITFIYPPFFAIAIGILAAITLLCLSILIGQVLISWLTEKKKRHNKKDNNTPQ